MLSVSYGTDRFVDIVIFSRLNKAWRCSFLTLPNGSPSRDTR
ncbi:MAG: transposase family protein [Caldilineaceae bacterium SB0664_bin_22]|nr:transposase family protein [Caldilineaceae bacterium SB0664_bin_22]MYC63500.1 transposase family protein [Caldilineaceae bacterium SB0661_bin_34]